jgi:DNA polymerase/3'-5' exonuclease PolX
MEFEIKPIGQLEREEIVRQVKEAAANMLETRAGNETYQFAWRRAAQLVRELDFKIPFNDYPPVPCESDDRCRS